MTSHPLVVGYDGRDPAQHALEYAFREAALREVPVVVLVVAAVHYEPVNPYEPGLWDTELAGPIPPEGPVEIQSILADARERLAASGVEGTVEWALGDPVAEILEAAERHQASALVVGRRHHSALARLIGADTTEALVRDAACDVLVAG